MDQLSPAPPPATACSSAQLCPAPLLFTTARPRKHWFLIVPMPQLVLPPLSCRSNWLTVGALRLPALLLRPPLLLLRHLEGMVARVPRATPMVVQGRTCKRRCSASSVRP